MTNNVIAKHSLRKYVYVHYYVHLCIAFTHARTRNVQTDVQKRSQHYVVVFVHTLTNSTIGKLARFNFLR